MKGANAKCADPHVNHCAEWSAICCTVEERERERKRDRERSSLRQNRPFLTFFFPALSAIGSVEVAAAAAARPAGERSGRRCGEGTAVRAAEEAREGRGSGR